VIAAGALLFSTIGQAQAAVYQYQYHNAKTRMCLSAVPTGTKAVVKQGSCSISAMNQWVSFNHDEFFGLWYNQIKNLQTGTCLDGNLQGDVYLSTCNETDPGQFWEWGSESFVYHRYSQKVLTGWDGGSVSLAPWASGVTNYDTWLKQHWGGQR
jgi:hypothetical protein